MYTLHTRLGIMRSLLYILEAALRLSGVELFSDGHAYEGIGARVIGVGKLGVELEV